MEEMRRILCPVDFSEATAFGVKVASSLTATYAASLELLHVLQEVAVPSRLPLDFDQLYGEIAAEAESRLEELADSLRQEGIEVDVEMRRGSPHVAIVHRAGESETDLIVMPTHERAGVDRLLHGSVSERVVRGAHCPVLAVPPTLEGLRRFAPRKILVATDLSSAATAAVDAAIAFASRHEAELVVAHVFTFQRIGTAGADWRMPTLTKEQVESAMDSVTHRLDEVARRVEEAGVEAYTEIGQGASPAREIAHIAEEEGAELVVVASHGHGGIRNALLGSTTEKLIRTLHRPLLVVRATER